MHIQTRFYTVLE